jgi:predicted enzyme involved in methoxymalonyl-ACP biosynthesis
MSCRVLGRTVEEATLNVLVEQARKLKASQIVGEYRPTEKNQMVAEHYPKFGFEPLLNGSGTDHDGTKRWKLPLQDYQERKTYIKIRNITS